VALDALKPPPVPLRGVQVDGIDFLIGPVDTPEQID
jgi:hypothetical protein